MINTKGGLINMKFEKKNIMDVVNKLRERCYPDASFGIVFYAHYAFSVSVSAKRKYVSFVQLPEYINDSFLLPNYVIDNYISSLPEGEIAIVRTRNEFVIKSYADGEIVHISTDKLPRGYNKVADIIDKYHLDAYFVDD